MPANKNSSKSDSPCFTDGDRNVAQSGMLPVNGTMDSNSKEAIGHTNAVVREAHCLSSLTVDALIFLFMCSFIARTVCVTNLFMEKACKFRLNYSAEICQNLTDDNYTDIKDEVEKLANDYSLYNSLVMFGLGGIAMMFFGPWSNKYGRKPPIILVMFGVFLDNTILLINTFYMDAPMEYILFGSIPSGLSGCFMLIVTMLNSMTLDVTPQSEKTFKLALLEFSYFLGLSLGTLVGGLLYNTRYTYYSVFGFSMIGNAVCIAWALFVVKETRGKITNVSWRTKVGDLFTCENFIDGFKCCLKVRENYGRCQIFMLLASMCVIMITYEAFSDMGYLYAYHIYGWKVTKYSEIDTIFSVSGLVVSVICIPLFQRFLNISDAGLGIIGSASIAGKFVITAFAENRQWLYYTGGVVGSFRRMSVMAVRARMSKLVHSEEIVNVFTFLAVSESLVPLAGRGLIVYVYDLTLGFFPGAAYLVGASLVVVSLGTFVWMAFLKEDVKYAKLKDLQIQENES